MTKGKLATLKEIRPVLTSRRQSEGLALRSKGLRSKLQHSNLFTMANLPLVINSVDKIKNSQ